MSVLSESLHVPSHVRKTLILCTLALGFRAGQAAAECAPFYDSLDTVESINANDGVITGPLAFAPPVNDSGAVFNGTCHVTYSDDLFAATSGSLSLWLRNFSRDEAGGILQIRTLGRLNSAGVFYAGQSNVHFELRSSNGELVQINAPEVLVQDEWTHIVAAWCCDGSACDLWLFINGRFVTHGQLAGSFNQPAADLQIGFTGYYEYGEGIMDELRFFDWDLLDSEVYAEYVYSSNRHRYQPTSKPLSTGPVQVVGKSLYVNDGPFTVKGVGYAPTPIGFWPWEYSAYTDPDIIARDIALLDAMNVNTVRTWGQPSSMLLDALCFDAAGPSDAVLGSSASEQILVQGMARSLSQNPLQKFHLNSAPRHLGYVCLGFEIRNSPSERLNRCPERRPQRFHQLFGKRQIQGRRP